MLGLWKLEKATRQALTPDGEFARGPSDASMPMGASTSRAA
jgi:hypothetical protein